MSKDRNGDDSDNPRYLRLQENDMCDPKKQAQINAINIIRNTSSSSQKIAEALTSYLESIETLPMKTNYSNGLTPKDIEDLIDKLDDNVIYNTSTVLITVQPTTNGTIGVLSVLNSTKDFIQNPDRLNNSNLTSAIIFNGTAIKQQISSMKVMILDEPKVYKNLNPTIDQYLVSSVIIVSVTKIDRLSAINIWLYFQIVNDTTRSGGSYVCSFLDTKNYTWNNSGCTPAVYNKTFRRYECMCNHLTSFALIWLPNSSLSDENLTAQDIGSLIFLSLSILAFILVITHAVIIRLHNRMFHFKPKDLLPLISSASTTILFIFYIALSMCMYTRKSYCISARVLMFFVYFFLIFMFCVKTSVGIFNYLRFVYLFPEPSFRKLYILLLTSFIISIGWTSFAAALDANPSFNVTHQSHDIKLYWFTRNFNFYFMAIPVGIFLLFNLMIVFFVAKRIIEHVRNATSQYGLYERRKQCILILLFSCVTQGVGWLFGPFISLVSSPTVANILGWIFVIFNGLEGVWTFVLYIIIRAQHLDESRQSSDRRQHLKKIVSMSNDNQPNHFYDLYDQQSIELNTSTLQLTDESK